MLFLWDFFTRWSCISVRLSVYLSSSFLRTETERQTTAAFTQHLRLPQRLTVANTPPPFHPSTFPFILLWASSSSPFTTSLRMCGALVFTLYYSQLPCSSLPLSQPFSFLFVFIHFPCFTLHRHSSSLHPSFFSFSCSPFPPPISPSCHPPVSFLPAFHVCLISPLNFPPPLPSPSHPK